VYRATLKSGETVAVKVQRPSVRETINADIRLLKSIAEWVEDNVQDFAWADPASLVDEFSRSIHRELDFAVERQIIDTFRENFADDDGVFIPRTYPAASSDKVLTMDFVDGVRIDALDQYTDRSSDPKVVAKRGCRAICVQVTEHRLFHADPHPGNILLTCNDQIAFLDFGMVGRLDRADVDAMAEALQGIFTHNVERCVQAVLLFTAAGEADDPASFERDINDYITFEAQAVLSGGLVAKALESMSPSFTATDSSLRRG
jgi:ubiquinone biosynthesis protein